MSSLTLTGLTDIPSTPTTGKFKQYVDDQGTLHILDSLGNDKPVSPVAQYQSMVYRLSQFGANPPTLTEYQNDTGETLTPSYDGVGNYTLLASGNIFASGKTLILYANNGLGLAGTSVHFHDLPPNTLQVYSFNNTNAPADSIMLSLSLEIRIYP